MARAKLATDRLLESGVCVCMCVCVYAYMCVCVYAYVWGEAPFFRRERQAVEAHRQAILPATAPRTANPEGKPHITTGSGVVTHSEARRGARSTPR